MSRFSLAFFALLLVGCGNTDELAAIDHAHADETDPVFAASGASGISADQATAWDEAAAWGDHGAAGYLTSETDPVYSASAAGGIIADQVTDWDMAYGWGDHGAAGYLTAESDPSFNSSAAAGIANGDLTDWDTAYAWGDHAAEGYLTQVPAIQTVQEVTTQSPARPASTVTRTVYGGFFDGGVGDGGTHTLLGLDTHRSVLIDVRVLVHDGNTNTNHRGLHAEYLVSRSWDFAPSIATMVTHYDYQQGYDVAVVTEAVGNDIQLRIEQTGGSAAAMLYTAEVSVTRAF